jgi:hypothetical protein
MIPRADILCLVLGHGSVAATIERHLPLWSAVAGEVVVCSPWNDRYTPRSEDVQALHHGISSRYGAENNHRVREALRFAMMRGKPYTLVCEYDAVVWPTGELPEEARPPVGGLAGARFTEPLEWAGVRFAGSQYFHFPLLLDRGALPWLVGTMDRLAPDAEGGYSDRYIGYAAELAKLPYVDFFERGLAYTKDTIEAKHARHCRAAIEAGARFSHGIKDRDILWRIMDRRT